MADQDVFIVEENDNVDGCLLGAFSSHDRARVFCLQAKTALEQFTIARVRMDDPHEEHVMVEVITSTTTVANRSRLWKWRNQRLPFANIP